VILGIASLCRYECAPTASSNAKDLSGVLRRVDTANEKGPPARMERDPCPVLERFNATLDAGGSREIAYVDLDDLRSQGFLAAVVASNTLSRLLYDDASLFASVDGEIIGESREPSSGFILYEDLISVSTQSGSLLEAKVVNEDEFNELHVDVIVFADDAKCEQPVPRACPILETFNGTGESGDSVAITSIDLDKMRNGGFAATVITLEPSVGTIDTFVDGEPSGQFFPWVKGISPISEFAVVSTQDGSVVEGKVVFLGLYPAVEVVNVTVWADDGECELPVPRPCWRRRRDWIH